MQKQKNYLTFGFIKISLHLRINLKFLGFIIQIHNIYGGYCFKIIIRFRIRCFQNIPLFDESEARIEQELFISRAHSAFDLENLFHFLFSPSVDFSCTRQKYIYL